MNFFIKLLVLWIFLAEEMSGTHLPTPNLISGDVGGGEHLVNGTVYLISTTAYRSLFSAANHCSRWGGKIASIPDQETFDLFKRLTANHYKRQPFFWVGVFSDCARETLLVAMNDSRAYSNCTADPDSCFYYGAGPNDHNDVLFESFDTISNCTFNRWVDFDGNNVTFLPFGSLTPVLGHHCTSMDVFDCEHEDGCRIGEYSNHECFPSHRHRFICEKPVENCQSYMEVPMVTHFDAYAFGSYAWEVFFGGNLQCGDRYVRIVINECARRYVDLRGLRLDSQSFRGDECFATNDNILTAELGNGTCGADGVYFVNGTYLDYFYEVRAELGPHGPPLASDVIRRDTSVVMFLVCDYLATDYTDLLTKVTANRRLDFADDVHKNGHLVASMSAFRDASLTTPLATHPGTPEIMVPDSIFVQAMVDDDDLALQLVSCWVSNSSAFGRSEAASSTIIDGCAAVDATILTPNNANSQEFMFSSFVIGNQISSEVYIHCTVHFCDADPGCAGCGGKRRRDISQAEGLQIIIGPIRITRPGATSLQKDVEPEHPLDLCQQKNCAHECRVLGRRALCSCPPGMLVANDGKSCVVPVDKNKWAWDDNKHEDNNGNYGVEFKSPTKKSRKVLKKSSVYVALGTFVMSGVLCVAAYRMWRSQVRSKTFARV